MRGLRFALMVMVITAFILWPIALYAGDGTIHRMKEKVPSRYMVMLYKGQPTEAIGPEMEKGHGGKVSGIMKELGMFSIDLPNEAAAEAIARDPRVALVQEDGVLHVAGCNRQLDPSGSQWALAQSGNVDRTNLFSDVPGSSLNSIRVYVMDSAIHTSYCVPSDDLVNQPYLTSKFHETQNFVDLSTERAGGHFQLPGPISSHGTAVASVIA